MRTTNSSGNAEKIWSDVLAKISPRGFLRTLVDSLSVLGTEGRSFLLGYPPSNKSSIETLSTPSNRRQLESVLREVTGREWSVKLSPDETLSSRSESAQPAKKAKEFKDDPLIQEALEMFKGQIKS